MLRDTMSCDLESRLKDLEAVLNSDQGRHLGGSNPIFKFNAQFITYFA